MGRGGGRGSPDGQHAKHAGGGGAPGGGGGGGGGGGAQARPVATITVGPNGVHVEPIVDVTKLGVAFFTALGAIFIARSGMRKLKKQLA